MTATTAVDTTQVADRRTLHFDTMDDLRREAQMLADSETITLGNWTLGQIFEHLALGLKAGLEGVEFQPPWWMKLMGPLVKNSMCNKPMKPGFRLPEKAAAQFTARPTTTTQDGLEHLLAMIDRNEQTAQRPPHPVFGKWTAEQCTQFHLRHAEMHLSFVIPKS